METCGKVELYWSAFYRDYTEEEIHQFAPREGGVYLLWVRTKSRKWRCFYVGASDNIESALLRHLSPEEENTAMREQLTEFVCGFEYARVAGEEERKGIVKFLYDRYKPDLNPTDPGGVPIKVNAP